MSRKSDILSKKENKTVPFESYDEQIAKMVLQKELDLEKSLTSNDPNAILKAQLYLKKQQENKKSPDLKSWMFLPDDYMYTGNGYKQAMKEISFEVLRRMGDTFVAKLVKQSRIDQVSNFLKFSLDDQMEGYTVRKKRGLFDQEFAEMTTSDKRKAEYIVNFLEHGGLNEKWELTDDLEAFIRKILDDSLTYDQLAFEIVRNRKGDLAKHTAVDASLIRLLDSNDPRYKDAFKNAEVNGFMPMYGMVWEGRILDHPATGQPIIYYPWELGFGVRNRSSSVRKNGYGTSELEVAVQIVTWILWSFQYNGNFFKQGSQPKGFLNIKNGNGDNTVVNELRQSWRQMMSGVENSHKIPVFEGIDLEWTDLQVSNRDMEFNAWMEFLLVVFCSVYRIDPSELGFHFKGQADAFGQKGEKERLQHSKEKGLKPLLGFLQKLINKYIVSEIDEEFEFAFTGVDIEDEQAQVDLDTKKVSGGLISFESAFEKYMGRPYDEKKDTILNPQFLQILQMKQMGGQGMNEEVDNQARENGEEPSNPFDDFGKANDPFIMGLNHYINKTLK